MRVKLVIFFLLVSVGLMAQKATVVTRSLTKYRNVEIVGQTNDSLSFLLNNIKRTIALSDVRKIAMLEQSPKLSFKKDRLYTSLTFQLNASRPSNEGTLQSDPALMLDFAYPVSSKLALGIGGGLQSPHFNTSLVPVFVNTEYRPSSNTGFFLKSRLGKFIPLAPDFFKGGAFSEWTTGYDFPSSRKSHLRMLLGYSHQRMIGESPNIWWSDRRTTYRYNRMTFGLGLIF